MKTTTALVTPVERETNLTSYWNDQKMEENQD